MIESYVVGLALLAVAFSPRALQNALGKRAGVLCGLTFDGKSGLKGSVE
ncbi:hypothetical protein [Ancylobacter sp. TS-1]|nr:hypothetical protein [Ancylobacter sp. TS-1]